MIWTQRTGHDDHHEIWVLENDKGELLARIEGFGREIWYAWVMDTKDTGLLRRIGPSSFRELDDVKQHCENILIGAEPMMSHATAAEPRDAAYRGDDGHEEDDED
jgi:hypothetical protein